MPLFRLNIESLDFHSGDSLLNYLALARPTGE